MSRSWRNSNVQMEITLSQSKEPGVKNTAPKVKAGEKWNPLEAVQYAQGTLHHRDIIWQAQNGRAGFRLGDGWKAWVKAEEEANCEPFFCKQEEETG